MFAPQRRSPVEYLVFALLAVLIAVVGYQVVKRGMPGLLSRGGNPALPSAQYRVIRPEPKAAPQAVDFVAPVKLTGKAGKKRQVSIAVPAPSAP